MMIERFKKYIATNVNDSQRHLTLLLSIIGKGLISTIEVHDIPLLQILSSLIFGYDEMIPKLSETNIQDFLSKFIYQIKEKLKIEKRTKQFLSQIKKLFCLNMITLYFSNRNEFLFQYSMKHDLLIIYASSYFINKLQEKKKPIDEKDFLFIQSIVNGTEQSYSTQQLIEYHTKVLLTFDNNYEQCVSSCIQSLELFSSIKTCFESFPENAKNCIDSFCNHLVLIRMHFGYLITLLPIVITSPLVKEPTNILIWLLLQCVSIIEKMFVVDYYSISNASDCLILNSDCLRLFSITIQTIQQLFQMNSIVIKPLESRQIQRIIIDHSPLERNQFQNEFVDWVEDILKALEKGDCEEINQLCIIGRKQLKVFISRIFDEQLKNIEHLQTLNFVVSFINIQLILLTIIHDDYDENEIQLLQNHLYYLLDLHKLLSLHSF